MRCLVCDSNDWKNVDQYRTQPKGMSLCKKCGFVSYPERVGNQKKQDELKDYYEKDYRKPPTAMNFHTGERKLQFHHHFLEPLFSKWKRYGKKAPVVTEIGAAYGMFLHWVRKNWPDAEVHGTELTESFRRNAWYEYQIYLDKEFDESLKYDLVSSYKVAEHIPDVDKEIRKYALSLKGEYADVAPMYKELDELVELEKEAEGDTKLGDKIALLKEKIAKKEAAMGCLYISVPCWFDKMTNFGVGGFDLEYYYHPDHINVWTRKLFETVLKKCGLRIVARNHTFYDETYLCVRDDSLMKEEPEHEDPKKIELILKKIQQADAFSKEKKYKEAVETFSNFPLAWQGCYELARADLHKEGGFDAALKKVLEPAWKACEDNADIAIFIGDVALRYQKYKESIEWLDRALNLRPNNPAILKVLAACFRDMAKNTPDPAQKLKYTEQARNVMRHLSEVSKQAFDEALTWIYFDNATLPMPKKEEIGNDGISRQRNSVDSGDRRKATSGGSGGSGISAESDPERQAKINPARSSGSDSQSRGTAHVSG